MEKLHILYDAYVLGLWQQGKGYRTGIGRVCVELLKAFLRRKDIVVTAFSPNGLEKEISVFLQSDRCFSKCGFLALEETYVPVRQTVLCVFAKCARRFLTHEMRSRLKRHLPIKINAGYTNAHPHKTAQIEQYLSMSPAWYFSCFYEPPVFLMPQYNIKKAVFVHDIIPLRIPQKHMEVQQTQQRLHALQIRTDLIVTNSVFTKEDLLDACPEIAATTVAVAPLACDAAFSPASAEAAQSIRTKYGIPEIGRYFLSVSTLEPRKGLVHALEAFDALLREYAAEPVYMVLVGQKGWQFEEIIQKACQGGSAIILTGFVDDRDLPALYSGCAAFVYMSEYEGFGLPILEAMACGAPVIASNTTSLPEVASDAALLLHPHDPNALKEAMRDILDDPELCLRLRTAGLARSKHFSWDQCAACIVEAMRSKF